MKRITTFLFALLLFSYVYADVDTIQVYSKTMGRNIPAIVVTPAGYNTSVKLPVVYLLHGHGSNYLRWITECPDIKKEADKYNFILVCPDGANSWYWNSPVDPKSQYETFISKELVDYIDSKYSTISNRTGRAITGLSMGGHGALYLAFKHQDIYGAAGSMSGGVDIRPFPKNWDMALMLGSYADQPERWEKNTVINLLHLLTPNSLSIIIDCGYEDFFYDVNMNLHQQLLYRNIPHDFITRPGAHNWNYWKNAVKYQLLYFRQYFDTAK
ncbi:MAG TPA: alpha/beta hydrolase family protein [Bacteroidales bacterium]|nr:alpha/beta hydrolase family protein [Bacteroidales bacterium]